MKLKNHIKLDKNLLIFLIVLLIVGIISGSLFVTLISSSDKALVTDYLNSFLDKLSNHQLDYLYVFKNSIISNIILVISIWLLGISVIGLPVMLALYFYKAFILGFSVGSIIANYHIKGIIFGLVYAIGQAILIFGLIILLIYAMSFSFKIINCILKKKPLDFRLIINKYAFILGIIVIITLIGCVYDSYLMPIISSSLVNIIR